MLEEKSELNQKTHDGSKVKSQFNGLQSSPIL